MVITPYVVEDTLPGAADLRFSNTENHFAEIPKNPYEPV